MNKPDRNEYTGISNKLFLDNELTLTEKGLLCQIASVPYGTVLTLADIRILAITAYGKSTSPSAV